MDSFYISYTEVETNEVIKNINNNYYWKFLLLIGSYYILPALQFVFFQAHEENVICYFNFKCKKELGTIPAFNNFISNILYIILGMAFIVIIKLTYKKYTDGISSYGVNLDAALYYSLGLALILEGICSGIYHICPSKLNFQFDTTFMFIGTALIFLTLYQKRHYMDTLAPLKFFSIMALIVFINILPLSGVSSGVEIWFWSIIFLLITYLVLFGSIYIYFGVEYDLNNRSLKTLYNNIRAINRKTLPKFLLVLGINIFTLGMYIWAVITKPNFTDWMLAVFIINMLIYFLYYIVQKIINRETIKLIWWIILVIDIVIFSLSLVYFTHSTTDKLLTPEQSRELNKKCVLFNYFDDHDIWHFLSAMGLFLFVFLIYRIDDPLNNLTYSEISKF